MEKYIIVGLILLALFNIIFISNNYNKTMTYIISYILLEYVVGLIIIYLVVEDFSNTFIISAILGISACESALFLTYIILYHKLINLSR